VTAALAAFGDSTRKAIDETLTLGDQDTSDVFTEVSRGVLSSRGSNLSSARCIRCQKRC
jgi:hypothetical protein